MTFEDALQVLDIDATVSRKAVRRAYLRLIKVHKPDRDPAGFQRVRAAYELVVDQIDWRRTMLQASDFTDDSADSPDVSSTPAPIEPVNTASASDAPLEEHPDPPQSTVEAPVFVAAETPAALMHAALQAVEDLEPAQAEDLAMRAFEGARLALNAPAPSAYNALHVCLILYAQGYARRARRVGQTFTQWLYDSGAERTLMGGWAAGRLAILHALLALPKGLHSTPLGIIAKGMLDDDFDIETALYGFARDMPFASLEVREALERDAQNLAEAWAGAMRDGEDASHRSGLDHRSQLSPPEPILHDPKRLIAYLFQLGPVLVALFVLHGMHCDSKRPVSASDRAELARALEAAANALPQPASPASVSGEGTGFGARTAPASAPPVDLSKHPEWVRTFCALATDSKCGHARSISAAFQAGRCAKAKQRYAWLSTDMMLAPKARAVLKEAGRTIKTTCAQSP